MLDRRQFVAHALTSIPVGLLASTGLPFTAQHAWAAASSNYPANDFIQIEMTDFSGKENRYDYSAYRIDTRGRISGARWNANRELLGLSKGVILSPVSFQQARDIVKGEFGWFRARKSNEGARFSNWVSVAHSSAKRTRYQVLHDPVPRGVAGLAKQLAASVPLSAPEHKGPFVLTSPVQRSNAQDLKIEAQNTETTMARAIMTSLSSDHLAVPVEKTRDVAQFFEGENTNRLVFAAKVYGRILHFTVVTAA